MGVRLAKLSKDFLEVAMLRGMALSPSQISSEALPAPHIRPTSLPPGKKAVYGFVAGDTCLKVGKAGPKSSSRFTSHHYNPRSSRSNLAKSILAGKETLKALLDPGTRAVIDSLSEDTVGNWVQRNTTRLHFFIDGNQEECVLALLEAFVQCRLRPVFEG